MSGMNRGASPTASAAAPAAASGELEEEAVLKTSERLLAFDHDLRMRIQASLESRRGPMAPPPAPSPGPLVYEPAPVMTPLFSQVSSPEQAELIDNRAAACHAAAAEAMAAEQRRWLDGHAIAAMDAPMPSPSPSSPSYRSPPALSSSPACVQVEVCVHRYKTGGQNGERGRRKGRKGIERRRAPNKQAALVILCHAPEWLRIPALRFHRGFGL